jgi:hypothetical protein
MEYVMSENLTENAAEGHVAGVRPDDTTMSPVDARRDYCRSFLEPYVRKSVTAEGEFDEMQLVANPDRDYWNAVMRDLVVVLPNRARYWVDHLTVRNASVLKDMEHGSRIRFRCTVHPYPNRRQPGQTRYGLGYPTLLEVIADGLGLKPIRATPTPTLAPASAPAPAPAPAPVAVDILAALTELVGRVKEAGGSKSIRELLATIDRSGGWDAVVKVGQLVKQLGGAERLDQFLGMLKGD